MASTSTEKPTALVVDDDPVSRRIHKMLLNKSGFEAHSVDNGMEAVDLFYSGVYFNLVLMDNEMPIMDGPEVTKALRAMGVGSMIVGITSRNLDSEQQEFMEAGLDYCHVKPMSYDQINALYQEISGN